METSFIRQAGFGHPDLRKLFLFAKQPESRIRIYVPHIAWAERRTQLSEEFRSNVRKVEDGISRLRNPHLAGIPLQALVLPEFELWSDSEIEHASEEAMAAFAKENKITIVPAAPDHGDRVWKKYFAVEPPFNPAEKRENRRKDIPDCWIFEVALDLLREHGELYALCSDSRLSNALKSAGIGVFEHADQIVSMLEEPVTVEARATVPLEVQKPNPPNPLDAAIAAAHESFKNIEIKVLGFVSFLDSCSKDQLFSLLEVVGINRELAHNVAERLALQGLIKDTGNHYIATAGEASKHAASLAEPEMIKLLRM